MTENESIEPVLRYVRLPEAIKRLGYGRSTIYSRIANKTMPAPTKLGARTIAWPEHIFVRYLSELAGQSASREGGRE